jgi:hypothetical protein
MTSGRLPAKPETGGCDACPATFSESNTVNGVPLDALTIAFTCRCRAAFAFMAAYNHPELIPVPEKNIEEEPVEVSTARFTGQVTAFALSNAADDVGVAPMDPLYVFEGYTVEEPWVIVLALAHNYERLKQVPCDETNGVGVCDIGDQYARGTRAAYALANWIRSQGYAASATPGPRPARCCRSLLRSKPAWENWASTDL